MQQGVLLRVKRRRDCEAPQQIVLEATSRTAELLTDFHHALAIDTPSQAVLSGTAVAERPKKRCRFVLLQPAAQAVSNNQQQQQQPTDAIQPPAIAIAAAGGSSVPRGSRVLDLWHSSGITTAAAAGVSSRGMGGRTKDLQLQPQQQPDQPVDQCSPQDIQAAATAAARDSGSDCARGQARDLVYEDMVSEYLQQQQQHGTALAAIDTSVRRPPSKRAARSQTNPNNANPASTMQPEQQQQQQGPQQQQTQLPEYMTREMLQQYGLLSAAAAEQSHKQHHQQQPLAAGLTIDPQGNDVHGSSGSISDDAMDADYVYDVYVPVYEDDMSVDGVADLRQQQQQQQQQRDHQPHGVAVVRLWEEDLADFDDLWSGYGTAAANAAAAAGDETEDSNAEDYYANSYPDEEDSYQHDEDSDDDNDGYITHPDIAVNTEQAEVFDNPPGNSLITSYKLRNVHRCRSAGVNEEVGTEEFDVDDYESSSGDGGDELQGYYNSGAAWRAILAKECGMGLQSQPTDEQMSDAEEQRG